MNDLPRDKWGNTAWEDNSGVYISDCVWISYRALNNNEYKTYPNTKNLDFYIWVNSEQYSYSELACDFVEWINNERMGKDDRIDMIYDDLKYTKDNCPWMYTTIESLDELKCLFREWILYT